MKIATIMIVFLATVASTQALYVKDNYPKGADYVFVCEADSETYDWSYGDGEKLYDVKNKDTYHTFTASGTYSVTCSTESGETEHISVDAHINEKERSEEVTTLETQEIVLDVEVQQRMSRSNGGYLLVVGNEPYTEPLSEWELSLKAQYEAYRETSTVQEYAAPIRYTLRSTEIPLEKMLSEVVYAEIH
jgi:hypothetical protein